MREKKIESENDRHAPIGSFPLSLSKSCPLPEMKGVLGCQPFKSASLKVINFYDRIFLRLFTLRRGVLPFLVSVLRIRLDLI